MLQLIVLEATSLDWPKIILELIGECILSFIIWFFSQVFLINKKTGIPFGKFLYTNFQNALGDVASFFPYKQNNLNPTDVLMKSYIPIEYYNFSYRKGNSRSYLKKSTLMVGAAGVGKSSFLMHLLLQKNRYKFIVLFRLYMQRKAYIYMKADDLALYNKNELRDENLAAVLKQTAIKKILLVDAFDENIVSGTDVIEGIKIILNAQYIMCSREGYAEKTNVYRYFENVIELRSWKVDIIDPFIRNYLSAVYPGNKAIIGLMQKAVVDYENLHEYNPLKLVMLITILSNSTPTMVINDELSFYESYLTTLLDWENKEKAYDLKTELDKLASYAFVYYLNSRKILSRDIAEEEFELTLTVSNIANIKKTLSKIRTVNDKMFSVVELTSFKHKTFEQYLVSKYLASRLNDLVNKPTAASYINAINAFKYTYNNDYSDYLTSHYVTMPPEDKNEWSIALENLYLSTMNPALRDTYGRQFKINLMYDKSVYKTISLLGCRELLQLKSNIIFFLCRLKTKIASRLNHFIYFNETIASYLEFDKSHEAILKRGCAVGASLQKDEMLEIDYVKKMESLYEYDLINRSHTLIYYGDVEGDIYDYRDDGTSNWDQARNKRISRLKHSLDEQKYANFRLFDFATIYYFIKSRPAMKLSEEEKTVILKADTTGGLISPERSVLATQFKDKLRALI